MARMVMTAVMGAPRSSRGSVSREPERPGPAAPQRPDERQRPPAAPRTPAPTTGRAPSCAVAEPNARAGDGTGHTQPGGGIRPSWLSIVTMSK